MAILAEADRGKKTICLPPASRQGTDRSPEAGERSDEPRQEPRAGYPLIGGTSLGGTPVVWTVWARSRRMFPATWRR